MNTNSHSNNSYLQQYINNVKRERLFLNEMNLNHPEVYFLGRRLQELENQYPEHCENLANEFKALHNSNDYQDFQNLFRYLSDLTGKDADTIEQIYKNNKEPNQSDVSEFTIFLQEVMIAVIEKRIRDPQYEFAVRTAKRLRMDRYGRLILLSFVYMVQIYLSWVFGWWLYSFFS